ncbi:MAG: M16 family metallopeptidase [Lautropia sp.]
MSIRNRHWLALPSTLLSAALAALVPLAPAMAAPTPVTEVEGITEYRLDNGLTVLLGADASKPTMTINLVYRVGSRHEGAGEAGMAHLLEHMLFRGTEQMPDPKQQLARRGMRYNGTTSYDRTNYFAQFSANDADRDWMLAWLADGMVNIRVTEAALDAERPVVLNEMQSSENRPGSVLFQQLMGAAYAFHPYGRAVIGSVSDLESVRPAQLQSFYHRYYRPDNAVLIVTGAFEPAATLAAVERAFGPIARPSLPVPAPYTLDRAQQGEREIKLRRAGGVPLLSVGYHMMAGAAREAVAMRALTEMLTRQPDGLLYEALVKTGLAVGVYGYPLALHDPGMVQFGATLAAGGGSGSGNADDNAARRDALWRAMQQLLEGDAALTEASLARTRTDYANSRKQVMESPEALAMALTESVALGDWRLFFAQSDWMETLTLAEVREVARRWLVRDNRTVAWYLPTTEPKRAPEPARVDPAKLLEGHVFRQQQAFVADFEMNAPSIDARTVTGQLPGGLKYALLPRRTKGDRVTVVLRLQWGDLGNLAERWKDADMLDRMIQSGTTSLPLQAYEDRLRELDARLDIDAGATSARVSLQAPKDRLDAALALAIESLRAPVFPADLYEERKRRWIASIESSRDQPDALVADALRRAAFQYPANDPRHYRPPAEMIADLRAHTLERMTAFWRDFAGASNAQFTAVGEFDPAVLKDRLAALLDDWKSPQRYQRIERPYHGLPNERRLIAVTDKPNAVYTATRALRIAEKSPDHTALWLAVRAFGADSGSRIARRLRERDGLTYGAYAALSADRTVENGAVSIRAIHAPANLAKIEAALREELTAVLADGFREEELADVKRAWLQVRARALADESFVAGLLASNLFWGDTMQRWQTIDARIAATPLADVDAAFRKYVKADDALVIGAGDYPNGGR